MQHRERRRKALFIFLGVPRLAPCLKKAYFQSSLSLFIHFIQLIVYAKDFLFKRRIRYLKSP